MALRPIALQRRGFAIFGTNRIPERGLSPEEVAHMNTHVPLVPDHSRSRRGPLHRPRGPRSDGRNLPPLPGERAGRVGLTLMPPMPQMVTGRRARCTRKSVPAADRLRRRIEAWCSSGATSALAVRHASRNGIVVKRAGRDRATGPSRQSTGNPIPSAPHVLSILGSLRARHARTPTLPDRFNKTSCK